uniref:Putative nuclear architecture related protein n=1 Tax=Triatoma dimidiata TaxID=72491 RepID=A0A0V0G935_TRIDM
MDSKFSSILQLSNLDDFITPSQECIKPVEIKKEASRTGSKIKIEDDGSYVEITATGDKNKLSRVDISLADCLACSGCITTAESVLITQQSHDELLRVFKNRHSENLKLIVVSLALQPILSIAAEYSLSSEICLQKLAALFKRLGADLVLEMGLADDFALVEEQREFLNRYQRYIEGDKTALPMLASTCPGWVCYAEKTKGHLLPNLSTCRSPQQIMGRLVKDILSKQKNITSSEIYHATLMPCYDKKLEASRSQFSVEGSRDVDCVITPVEMMLLIRDECAEGLLNNERNTEIDWPWKTIQPYRSLCRVEGSGSGGYAHHILAHAKKAFFNYSGDIPFETVTRKSDILLAKHEENGKSLKVSIVTGFRNIQNVVNKMKRGTCDYNYIEIMACPSGCLNGGAQVKGHLKQIEQIHSELAIRNVEELHEMYSSWLEGFNSDKVNTYLHTTFEPVTFNPNPLSIKW